MAITVSSAPFTNPSSTLQCSMTLAPTANFKLPSNPPVLLRSAFKDSNFLSEFAFEVLLVLLARSTTSQQGNSYIGFERLESILLLKTAKLSCWKQANWGTTNFLQFYKCFFYWP